MKGYALLIGVSETNETHYDKNLILNCAKTDVEEMEFLFRRIPYYVKDKQYLTSLKGPNASFANTINYIKNLNETVTDEAYFVLYFSGHGASIRKEVHQLGYESIGYFCFYDQMVNESQLRKLLETLNSNFKVLSITDSCFGGELINSTVVRGASDINPVEEYIDARINDEVSEYKMIESPFAESVFLKPKNRKKYMDELKNYSNTFSPNAEVAMLTACAFDQKTESNHNTGKPSGFTRAILSSWYPNMEVGLDKFKSQLILKRQPNQTPQLRFFGKQTTDFFFKTKPFAFSATTTGIEDLSFDNFEEKNGEIVKLHHLPGESSGFLYKYSDTYKTSHTGHNIPTILAQLRNMGIDTSSFGVIGVVYVSINASINFPHEIDNYRTDEALGVPGMVVVINNSNGVILHKGRTKGKVSNQIGGDN